MAEQLDSWLKAQRVPKDVWPAVSQIIETTDAFCDAHLDAEYADLCRALAGTLGRKRPSPLSRGDRRIWAAGIVHTVGWVNFLADPAQKPHLRTEQLAELLGVKQTTMSNKGALIRGLLHIDRFDTRFARKEMIEKNPFTWLVEVDGLPMDARLLPEQVQQELVRCGIIPHVSRRDGQ
ncbi:hypothetical protein KGA66_17465 [Actinocrinis puniceicyclus]|uniref:DUF6398 domain-containing protein n=1 Tax=Actinocrinis puniceicyclus TaxID=977794 RepID=A0A8J7WQB4_9ACTN|nr:DUF6398 domain-containing protein [Actinocrinis puniceicyclus]MBS2964850.1 hypothetical protein [Actinocrinis puniceicyclus]